MTFIPIGEVSKMIVIYQWKEVSYTYAIQDYLLFFSMIFFKINHTFLVQAHTSSSQVSS